MYSSFIADEKNAHKALHEKLTNMFLRIDQLKDTTDKWLEYIVEYDEKMKLRDEKKLLTIMMKKWEIYTKKDKKL